MTRICCECKKVLSVTIKDLGVVSHGYCKKCLKEFREANGLTPEPLEIRQ